MNADTVNDKKIKYVEKFKNQLIEGIAYYSRLKNELKGFSDQIVECIPEQLKSAERELAEIKF
ncbi:hypothetical protein [Sphingobacterium sp. IITKGP-BTPF85]|nr:hypothetical protein [Sphingobacterium sp. IITKGP-BTPF85]KKX48763.1 hypothetical protein L950_0219190 [Sphingobacterium sp. IITKGP-BTPF85]